MNEQTPFQPASQHSHTADVPVLDRNIPKLDSGLSRKMNRKALLFVVVIGLAGVVLATTMFKQFANKWAKAGEGRAKEKEELIIPDRPVPRGATVPEIPDMDALQAAAQAQGGEQAANTLAQQQPPLPVPADMMSGMPPISAVNTNLANSFNNDRDRPPSLTDKRLNSGAIIGADNKSSGIAAGIPGLTAPLPGQALGQGEPVQLSAAAKLVNRIKNPDTLLTRGTYIRCTLESKIVSDVNGYTTCITTEPIYSVNGQRLLIPRGSKVSGQYGGNGSSARDQSYDRLAVLWERIITPTGLDITLNSPGIDTLGGSGHPGDYDAHWVQRLGAAIMVSMIGDVFNYQATAHGPKVQKSYVDTSTGKVTVVDEPFNSKTVETISKIPEKVLAQTINRAPTVTINQGEILNIYTAQDIDFSRVLED